FEQAALVSSPTSPVCIGEGDEIVKVDADLIRAGTLRVGTGSYPKMPEGIRDEETALQVTGKGVRVEIRDAAGNVSRDVVVLQGTESVHFLPPGRYALKVTPKEGDPHEETVEVRASEVVRAGILQR
ncbi:MAG: hypothetical protein HUU06_04945, partial [Planctomycetaceae bacterium]|nr:hypothetical protein [Planctomycetaceae bacterium]